MEGTAGRPSIDIAAERPRAGLALLLAVLSVPGSTITWDILPGGGFVFGAPLAIAAVILGAHARRHSQADRGKALAAILIAGAMLAMIVVWTIAESL